MTEETEESLSEVPATIAETLEPENLTKTLVERIEDLVWQLDISYMDAVIQLAEELDMEVEVVASHAARNVEIFRAIRAEAEALNYIEKENRLEF